MITFNAAQTTGETVDPRHEVKIVCAACGYDLDKHELAADTCSDCGAPLNLAQHVAIYVTSVPAAHGSATL